MPSFVLGLVGGDGSNLETLEERETLALEPQSQAREQLTALTLPIYECKSDCKPEVSMAGTLRPFVVKVRRAKRSPCGGLGRGSLC